MFDLFTAGSDHGIFGILLERGTAFIGTTYRAVGDWDWLLVDGQ